MSENPENNPPQIKVLNSSPQTEPPPANSQNAPDATAASQSELKQQQPASQNAPDATAVSIPSTAPTTTNKSVPFSKLFAFATPFDMFCIYFGCFCALLNGLVFPLFTIVFAGLLNAFSSPNFESTVAQYSLYFLYIAIGAFICGFFQAALPMIAAERQMRTVRSKYIQALLRQDQGWHDTNRTGEAASRLAEETILWQTGIGEKLTGAVQFTVTFIAGLAVGFSKSWLLTLVVLGCSPILIVIIAFLKVSTSSYESAAASAYARAGDACAEVISLIRSVASFGGEAAEVKRYDKHLDAAEKAGYKKGIILAGAVASIFSSMFMVYGVATYVGTNLIIASRERDPMCRINPLGSGCFSGGDVISTFMAVLIGSFAIGQAGPNFAAFGSSQAAAFRILEVINRTPEIDIENKSGHKPSSGSESKPALIEFRNVSFSYPSRPTELILDKFSLVIEPGSTVALVGESGSGKSTLIQLIERYYDALEGSVLVDNINVKDWNLKALRDRIGLVQQDPLLFGVSVIENIKYGSSDEVSLSDIEAASKAANAHSFVSALPEGYQTLVGTSVASAQLSGGQRQRICIARAIIRNPRILLLDEATSALDTESERIVQESIDNLLNNSGTKRTTVIIAHRLSTIRSATKIVVMSKGKIAEMGTHEELMNIEGGLYHHLRQLQDSPTVALTTSSSSTGRVSSLSSSSDSAQADKALKKRDEASSPKVEEKEEDIVEEAKKLPPVDSWRVWRMQSAEWPYIVLALVASLAAGTVQPIFSLVYTEMISVFFQPDDAKLRSQSLNVIGWFFALAAGNFVASFLRIATFSYLGEKLTRRLRTLTYSSILRQPMSFFDNPKNSAGRLGTRLGTDSALVRGGTGEALGIYYQSIAAILAAAIISFTASWRLALVMSSVAPFVVWAHIMTNASFVGFSKGAAEALEESGHIATEAATGIRTVAAFNLQGRMQSSFDDTLEKPLALGVKKSMSNGVGIAFSSFIQFATNALGFYVGSIFITQGHLDFNSLIKVFFAVTLASQAVGSAASWGPDKAKAEAATRAIFAIIDSVSPIDAIDGTGEEPSTFVGDIELKNVSFCYPQRPETRVLNNVSLKLKAGTTTALVGESGSGKSSIVALLQRFYDVKGGSILIDGIDVRQLKVSWLRSNTGLVQQEPSLFADSIAYNILYGAVGSKPEPDQGVPVDSEEDSTKKAISTLSSDELLKKKNDAVNSDGTVTKVNPVNKNNSKALEKEAKERARKAEEIAKISANFVVSPIAAQSARDANAYDFIMSFVHGFATHVGSRGSQLSGGQKQRIAIARAITRNPKLLLLDEATSALDSESERIVQAALDELLSRKDSTSDKRTTVVVAHRLSTIKNADVIVVMSKGEIVEKGSYNELMAIPDGNFRRLALAQEHSGGGSSSSSNNLAGMVTNI
jgi:ATP-binding cassette, subfamily B (MDR/TAP), member 1